MPVGIKSANLKKKIALDFYSFKSYPVVGKGQCWLE